MIKANREEREHACAAEVALLSEILKTRTADEWEAFFQPRHVSAARVRSMADALADPHLGFRGVRHEHAGAQGVDGSFSVPIAAFQFADGGPRVDTPPPALGQHSDAILAELGYGKDDVARLRKDGVV